MTKATYSDEEFWTVLEATVVAYVQAEKLPGAYAQDARKYLRTILQNARKSCEGVDCPIIGVNGPQGSGKSTFARLLAYGFQLAFELRSVVISIDDFYYGREVRDRLAREFHPLFSVRGAPGTHDVQSSLCLIEKLRHAGPGEKTLIPKFDKALDEPSAPSDCKYFTGRPDLIILEGWCVGVPPQSDADLLVPVNDLERIKDSEGVWRRRANKLLAEEYAELFRKLNFQISLVAPSFAKVVEWRQLQEKKLRSKRGRTGAVMTDDEVAAFTQFFERLTVWSQESMPEFSDIVLVLDDLHRWTQLRIWVNEPDGRKRLIHLE